MQRDYIALFLKKAIQQRLPEDSATDGNVKLKRVNPTEGWLAERWHLNQKKRAKAAPYSQYKSNPHDAFWYFDREMAERTEARYAQSRNKKEQYLGFLQNGKLLKYDVKQHVRVQPKFTPAADGITFHLKAVFTDSLRTRLSDEHAEGAPVISRICGPVQKVNDTTFVVSFYRMGMDNPRRTGEICLLASQTGDRNYKSAVQELSFRIPYRNVEGKRQYILFPGLPDVKEGTASLDLNATSDCGLPVSYYIKEGPKLYKRNGYYYIFAPAGGVATGWQLVLRSRNVYGPYEKKIVMAQGTTDINGSHQGAWVDTPTGESWFIHFQDKAMYGRIIHLNPMTWINDWPIIGEDKDGNGCGEPVTRHKKPNV